MRRKSIAVIAAALMVMVAVMAGFTGCGDKSAKSDKVIKIGLVQLVEHTLEGGIRGSGAVTPMLERGMTPEEILTAVCPGMKLKVLETTEVSYRCYCSRERVKGALISLGKKELEEIAAEGETVHIGCQFCDADYQFGPEEIQNLLLEI